jgi:YfiH family protein
VIPLLRPAWPAPPGVGAAMSLRPGGASVGAWASLNLGAAVGDDPAAVAANRAGFAAALGALPVWLRQVHGTDVLRLSGRDVESGQGRERPAADAAWTTEPGIACAVLVADCLPVLLAARDGSAVAAAHAGWRGLAAGVLEATVGALRHEAGVAPHDLLAWLGPCIGPRQFEVGADVLLSFGQDPADPDTRRFQPRPRADGSARWLAHLPLLARDRLLAAGLVDVWGAERCTVEDASAFFSFRRDGVTGRHAAAILRG